MQVFLYDYARLSAASPAFLSVCVKPCEDVLATSSFTPSVTHLSLHLHVYLSVHLQSHISINLLLT